MQKKKIGILLLATLALLPLMSAVQAHKPSSGITIKEEATTIVEYQIEPDPTVTLHLALGYYADKLNPAASTTAYDLDILLLLFDGYMYPHPFKYFDIFSDMPWMLNGSPEWQVVEDPVYGNISYWIFKFRNDIYFFDGTPLTAEDVVFTYDFMKWLYPYSEAWYDIGRIIINATAIDQYTVKVYLNTTGYLSARYAFIIIFPKHIYGEATTWDPDGTGTFPSWSVTQTQVIEYRAKSPSDPILTGYGPFKLKSWSPSGLCTEATTFLLERNPDYFMRAVDENDHVVWEWHELTPEYVDQYGADALRGPYVKYIEYKVIIETADIVNALITGEIDMAADFAFGRYYSQLVDAGMAISYAPRLGFGHTFINCRNWPLSESAFRRALAYAYDKRAVCERVWAGWAEPLDVPVPKSMGEWSIEYLTLKPDSYADMNKPKALSELAKLNISDKDNDGWLEDESGQEITITIEGTDTKDVRDIVTTLASSVEEVGIHVNTVFVDFRTLISHLVSGAFDILFFGFGLTRLPYFLEAFASWSLYSQLAGWSNATYDDIIDQAFYNLSNLDTIREYLWDAQLIFFYELPLIPIYQNVIVGAYRSFKDFGVNGWAGVFESLTGGPVTNGYTIMKCVKPKSISVTTITILPPPPPTPVVTSTVVTMKNTTVSNVTTVKKFLPPNAAPWLGFGVAIDLVIILAAYIVSFRKRIE